VADSAADLARVEAAWGVSLGGLPAGASLSEMIPAMQAGELGVLYVLGADPALAVADEKTVRAALDKVDFVVLQDSFLTDTAAYADVVLPAAVAAEDEGTFTNGERVVQRVRAAVPALGQSLPDWRIVQSVANSLGADWAYAAPVDVMREIADVAPAYKGVTYDKLDDSGVAWPCVEVEGGGTPMLFTEEFAKGKGGFAAAKAGGSAATGDAAFPLVLVSGSVRGHHGTGVRSRRAPGLTKLMAEACLEINPQDAGEAKVADGDKVRVTGQAGGVVEVTVRVTARVPEGVVFLPGFSAAAPVGRLQTAQGGAVPVRVERLR
jgi:predicted molibdopterin-dependent oxidoreductase YjgC